MTTAERKPIAPGNRLVCAEAHPNVALVKYWGKRDRRLNLPSVGSISLTLDTLCTRVSVRSANRETDEFSTNGKVAPPGAFEQLQEYLQFVRTLAGRSEPLVIETHSNFPVAAGLASSASMFAALAVALNEFYGLALAPRELTALARRGSGSAARSIFGGFVEWHRGTAPDGSDSVAEPLAPADAWPLGVVVAITDVQPKSVSSRNGMEHAATSPFFPLWVSGQEADLASARAAIANRDLEALGHIAERNCLKMHAVAWTSTPPLLYWRPATLAAIETVRALRSAGVPAYFTIDAGPQVKVLCPLEHRERVAAALHETPGIVQVLLSRPGSGARLLSEAGT